MVATALSTACRTTRKSIANTARDDETKGDEVHKKPAQPGRLSTAARTSTWCLSAVERTKVGDHPVERESTLTSGKEKVGYRFPDEVVEVAARDPPWNRHQWVDLRQVREIQAAGISPRRAQRAG